jgi:hypothetical protein
VQRVLNATRYSFAGLAAALRHEPAFRSPVALLLVAVPAAFRLGNTGVERALLIAAPPGEARQGHRQRRGDAGARQRRGGLAARPAMKFGRARPR